MRGCVLVALAVVPATGLAQGRAVVGEVRGAQTDTPVAQALVAWLGRPSTGVLSSSDGRFRIVGEDQRLVIMAIGYRPDTVAVPANASLVVRLEPAPLTLAPLVVAAARAARPPIGEIVANEHDLLLDSPQSSQELLRKVPGLVIAQHGGGGKAEQIFLRGFDADHGTDVAISVDGVPVNLVSHAHGQGYADLHFLIPEVVDRIEVRKGGHDPRDGNLATAGAVRFVTKDRIDRATAWSRGGSFGSVGLGGMTPIGRPEGPVGGYLAVTGQRTNGPFEQPQGFGRANAYAKVTARLGDRAEAFGSGSGYWARWDASGQIPERAVATGQIGRFGAIDPTEGGSTARTDLVLGVRSRDLGDDDWQVRAFLTRYRLDLYSNFTFFLRDSIAGDGIAQFDDRAVTGVLGSWGRRTKLGQVEAGFSLRSDLADVSLADQAARSIRRTRLASRVSEQNGALWARQEWALSRRATLDLGIRADLFRFSVADRTIQRGGPDAGPAGRRLAGRLSPKLVARLDAGRGTTLVAALSSAFHSNDARDVVTADGNLETLPRAVTGELGITRSWSGGAICVGAWRTDLASELVFVGDEGVTEPSGRTRRLGIDIDGRWRLASWLWADGSLNLVRGRLRDEPDGANRIPLAPPATATLGLVGRGVGPLAGALRLRYLGDRPADEAGAVIARGAAIAAMSVSWRLGRGSVSVAVDNLLNRPWQEAQFATTSRLRGERTPVTELHYTPGAPRRIEIQLNLDW